MGQARGKRRKPGYVRTDVIPLLTTEASLKRSIRRHLRGLGFTLNQNGLDAGELSKVQIRSLHRAQRKERLHPPGVLAESWRTMSCHFAAGDEVSPSLITPRLEIIKSGSWQSELFAFASLYWSVPISQGYGRRLRFLCWDQATGKLMGLLALGDPVFNLSVRDNLIGWSGQDRKARLSAVMDAYVLGALPPYNQLLAGKLIACLLRSREIVQTFKDRYRGRDAIMSQKQHAGELALITTSSALGRSSVYNRLTLGGQKYLTHVGSTKGYGHFHIPQTLFNKMRAYLEAQGHEYAHGHAFGQGPNWRMRVIREALTSLGLSPKILRHGIPREVYICELGEHGIEFLRGTRKRIDRSSVLTVDQIAEQALARWVIPRAMRDSSYRTWSPNDTYAEICAPYRSFADPVQSVDQQEQGANRVPAN